jgi:phosphoribosylanthranilate isomerase
MALKTKVKVGKITTLSDARYCAGMGVDFLGFPCGTDSTTDFQNFKDITSWVSGPSRVVEWMDQDITPGFLDLVQPYNADYLQVRAQHVEIIPDINTPLIATISLGDWPACRELLLRNKKRIAFILVTRSVDTRNDLIRTIAAQFPMLLNIGENAGDLERLLQLPIAGLALDGTTEELPGLKDYTSLSDVLEQLEVQD